MKSNCRIVACVMAGGLLACGGSDSGTSAPTTDGGVANDGGGTTDSGGGTDAGLPDSASDVAVPVAVKLLDTTPADATLHVGVLTPVKLHFSGSLEASSVTTTSVLLLAPNATVGIPSTVAYDDTTHTITLTPKFALTQSSVYRVTTTSLIAADSSPIANAAVSFTTLYGNLNDSESYNAAGTTVTGVTTYVIGADGRATRRATMAKGPDMIFQTADDVPSAYTTQTFGAGTVRSVNYNGAGVDAMWFTIDDTVSNYNDADFSVFGRTRSLYHSGAGADAMWQTADDVIGTFSEIMTTPEGRELKAANYSGPGPDNIAFTADDVQTFRFADTWTATTGQRIGYSAAGADGVWGTADDVIANVNNYTLDAFGRRVGTTFVGSGPDGVFLTADDTTTQGWVWNYDATTGVWLQWRILATAGPDGIWLTSDDVPSYYYGMVYDASGALVTRKAYDVGPDGIWYTADDIASSIEHYNTSL